MGFEGDEKLQKTFDVGLVAKIINHATSEYLAKSAQSMQQAN